jgi:squalene-hopene/tetraprenyl-beta-curcumene cyclase
MENRSGVRRDRRRDDPAELAVRRARSRLLAEQSEDGFWCGELQGDSILESEYILTKFILAQDDDPDLPPVAAHLRRLQVEEGGWTQYPGGPVDLSGTAKAYFALKLMGDDPEAAHMVRAREWVRRLGGAGGCNTFTKFFFACLGQIGFEECPSIPPEIVLLPRWFYFNLYRVSAWTRTMIVPLGIVTTMRYARRLPPALGIAELYLGGGADGPDMGGAAVRRVRGSAAAWRWLFVGIDRLLKHYERAPIPWLRRRALREAERWLLSHLDGSQGLGAIFPPMVYMLVAFRCLGYRDDHPRVQAAHRHLRDLLIREGDAIRVQPCPSPVWDTGLALHALAESGLSADSLSARRAARWLLEKECRFVSDRGVNCPEARPGGWFFEFANPHYPDADDTAMVTMALKRAGGAAAEGAVLRGLDWLLDMQNADGGWAAFDKTRHRPLLENVPFADHNAMQDPSCPDIAGRVLECLGRCGLGRDHEAVRRAIAFLRGQQDDDGAWWGRWGVNFVYGTWQVLAGLASVGEDMSLPYVQRAVTWLRSVQKADGSFGESPRSYEDADFKGKGPSSASQTAWGALGLLAGAATDDPAICRAIDWLIAQQGADGGWEEDAFTGTGFPKVFYLKYHLYRLYFPLTALSAYRRLIAPDRP